MFESVSTVIIEIEESSEEDTAGDEDILDLRTSLAKASIEDVTYGTALLGDQVEAENIVREFLRIFTDVSGTRDVVEHHIRTTNSEPLKSKSYNVRFSVTQFLQRDIGYMLKTNVIRKSDSRFASPVGIVNNGMA